VSKLRRYKHALIVVACACLLACSWAERHAIHAVLDARTHALETMNIQAYSALISDDYQDGSRDKAAVIAEMSRLFHQFDAIRMDTHSQEIRVLDEHTAQCEQSYTLKVKGDGVWRHVTRREQLLLQKQAGAWKIVAGL